ncbi:MAG: CARDB domain-containing protein [Candidatus Bipolaricaulia bacterium]
MRIRIWIRSFILILGLTLLLALSGSTPVLATEWLVPRDFPNPAACIAAAAPGDSCILQPGTHPGFTINKPNLTVISSNGALATTVAGPVTIAADGVTLGRAGQGLLITGGVVISAPSTSGITIEDNLITGNPGHGILVNPTVGAVRDFSFLANQIRNNGGGGIIFLNAGSADGIVITGNAIETNTGGPGLGFAIGGSVRRLQVSNTRITTNALGGVIFAGPTGDVEDSELSGNMIQGNGAFGLGLGFGNTGRVLGLIVSGNNISSHTTDNVRFANGLVADTRFENNTIENAGANGVNFSNTGAIEEVSFNNDTIQRNGQNGLRFSNSDDIDTVEIADSRVRNNGRHNIFVDHLGANDFPVERFTIEGGFIDQAQDNGVRIATVTASIDSLRLVDVQISKNGGMGVCLRTNTGSLGDLEFRGVTVKENQGGAGLTPCDLAPAPIGSGVEVITLTGNIGPVQVSESAFSNNGGFGLRLDSLGPAPAAGDLGPITIRSSRFDQNGTRAPAGLGSGLSLRGRNVHDIAIDPTTASGNNDHGIDIQAANDLSGITITAGEFSANDRNVDTIGAGLNLSATQRLTGLRVIGAKLANNSQGARVQAGRASDNHLNQCELSGNRRAGLEAAIASGEDLDGTSNWWGSPSGPSGLGPGTGDAVTADVNFAPWLTAPPPPAVVTGANFQITSFSITPPAPDVGATVTISSTVTNTGTDAGTQEIIVRIKSGVTVLQEERRLITLSPAGSTTLTVSYAFTAAGTYTVEVTTNNDSRSQTVTVGGGGPPPPGGTIEAAIASLVPGDPSGAANPSLVIGDQEILQAISFWINGEPVPGTAGETINDAKMLELISLWIGGTPVSGSAAGLASALVVTPGNQTALKVERIGFTGSRFIVQGRGIESIAVRVWDLSGRSVFSGEANGSALAIDGPGRAGLANGVYLYAVTVRGFDGSLVRSAVRKLVVLR